jgi:hypothetical protein
VKFRWPWTKRSPPLKIPPYKVPVASPPKAIDPGIHVEEHDASDEEAIAALRLAQTQTGIHRAWKRITGK